MTNEEIFQRLLRIDFDEINIIMDNEIKQWISRYKDTRSISVVYNEVLSKHGWSYNEFNDEYDRIHKND